MKEIWALAFLLAFGANVEAAQEAGESSESSERVSSTEMERLFQEDQADRTPATGKQIDWEAVGMRDEARERRVKELVGSDALQTGAVGTSKTMVSGTSRSFLYAAHSCRSMRPRESAVHITPSGGSLQKNSSS
jgi:hypothetical protein